MKLLLRTYCFCLLLIVVVTYNDEYSHNVDLQEESEIKIRWKNTPPDADGQQWIIMEASAKARGYIGVGWSPHGGMEGGDMAIAWIGSDGRHNLRDFYGIMNGPPIEDPKQDYQLLDLKSRDGWLTVKLKRRWDTCDPNDMQITNDTMRLIWAYSDSKPNIVNGEFRGVYHGPTSRGVRSVIVADGGAFPRFPDQAPELYPGVKFWDIRMPNISVTNKDTTYHCKIVKFTDLSRKHHLIGWRPLIQKENRDIVHHISVYECNVPEDEVASFDRYHESDPGGTCNTPNMPPDWGKNCVAFSFTWVVGSDGEMLPNHVGAPLGQPHGGATYFMFEMHYENPAHRIITDSSGVRVFYTDKLRRHDGGTILVGYRHSPFMLIPPNQENFVIHGVCGTECTETAIPPTGIHFALTLVHMHLVGKKIRLRHFRDGNELPVIAEDNHYDFNYQQTRILKNEITVLPSDNLVVECEYATKDARKYIIGGLATFQEMCQVFVFYYPRLNLTQCTSQYEFNDFFRGLGIQGIEGKVLKTLQMPYEPHLLPPERRDEDIADDARKLEAIEDGMSFKGIFNFINITKPYSQRGKSVGRFLEEIHWTDKRGKALEKFWKEGKHYQFCSKPGSKRVILDNHITDYPIVRNVLKKEVSAVCKKEGRFHLNSVPSQGGSVALISLAATLAAILSKIID